MLEAGRGFIKNGAALHGGRPDRAVLPTRGTGGLRRV